jgi:hypothetical protein
MASSELSQRKKMMGERLSSIFIKTQKMAMSCYYINSDRAFDFFSGTKLETNKIL